MDDPDLSLLIAACQAAHSAGGEPLEPPAAIKWDRFAALAQRHRVEALCWHGLGNAQRLVQPNVAGILADATRQTVAQGMKMTAECGRLNSLFQSARVDCLFIKGVALGALAYPANPFLKMSLDIDLLVRGDELHLAVAVLRSAGYVLVIPANETDERIERWHRTRKESVWRGGQADLQIDLHTRLADHPSLIPSIGMDSPRQSVTAALGIDLPTLATDELFAYLCAHGASSAWFRLKWLSDLVALVPTAGEDEVARLYDRSQQLGAGRAAAQALLLAEKVFGMMLSEPLGSRLRADPICSWLTWAAMQQLTAEREPLDRTLGTLSIHASQLFMLPGASNVASQFAWKVRSILAADQ